MGGKYDTVNRPPGPILDRRRRRKIHKLEEDTSQRSKLLVNTYLANGV
jgi:hypothetical protein